jgi:hypothetical protein
MEFYLHRPFAHTCYIAWEQAQYNTQVIFPYQSFIGTMREHAVVATVNTYMLCVKCLYKRPAIKWSSLARPCHSLGTCLPLHLALNIDGFSCHPSIPPS